MVEDYCNELKLPSSPTDFVNRLKSLLTSAAKTVDLNYPNNGQVIITEDGEPILKRMVRKESSKSSKILEKEIMQRLPEERFSIYFVTLYTGRIVQDISVPFQDLNLN